MELRNRLSIFAWDDRPLCFDQVVEVLIEYGDGSWAGMIESSLAVEFADTSVDVDLQIFSCGGEGL